MELLPGNLTSAGKISRAHSRGRTLFGAGLGALALAGITAATALPSRTKPRPSAAEQKPQQGPVPYLGAAAERQVTLPGEADPHARRFTGTVGGDLTSSLQAAGVPERQGREYVAVLARAIDLAGGLSVGDRFDLVLERGSDGKLGQLLYVGLDRIGRADVELLKWTDGKHLIWVNGDGVGGETSAGVRLPLAGRVTSQFGERFHPILGYVRFHKGVDLGASAGTPIVAAADGRVVSAGWHGGYGRQVAIAHAGGMETTYGHMSRIAAHSGEFVRQGQVIGYVGSSGLSTGPHLHFEVSLNGRPVNPLSVKLKGGPAQLQGEKLQVFQDQLRGLLLLQTS